MSEDESKNNSSKGQPDVPIVPVLNTENEGSKEAKEGRNANEDTKAEGSYPVKLSRFQAFMHKHFPEARAHDRWTLVFTFVIAVSTFFYTIFAGWTLYEIHSGSADTHNLAVAAAKQESHTEEIAQAAQDQVDAANEISDAADSFSDTADKIREDTSKAVSELKRQANNSQKALSDSILQANLDRRPWVGLQLLQCNNCKTDEDGNLIIGDLSAVLVNTGKTPAVEMVIKYIFENARESDPIPTYDAIEKSMEARRKVAMKLPSNMPPDMAASIAKTMALEERNSMPPKEVLAPNAQRGITIMAGLKQVRNRMARMEDRVVVYGLGKVTYYDGSRSTQYTTTFCVMNDFGASFQYCPSGNDMN